MNTAIERVKPGLREFWPYWNLGARLFFQEPHDQPTARLRPWKHTEKLAERDHIRAMISTENAGRWVPVGDYAKLEILFERRSPYYDFIDNRSIWTTVMSDTPDEMNDHADVILNANGRVLIHGLGLGCVLNCLLHKPDVTHIDVVETSEDVIRLVGEHYLVMADLQNKSLQIHHDSCATKKWPKGTRWNYVWHDIWSTISASNLRQDDDPEYGISYELMHRKFQNRCDRQGSWAFDKAKTMRDISTEVERRSAGWAFVWNVSSDEDRFQMWVEAQTNGIGIKPEDWIKMLSMTEDGKAYLNKIRKRTQRDMEDDEAQMIVGDQIQRYAQYKRGMLATA